MAIADRTVAGTRAKGTGRAGRDDPPGRRLAVFGAWLIPASMALAMAGADERIPESNEGRPTAGQAASSPPKADSGARGALVICGGGGLPESVRREFLKLAGGAKAKLVVIPTASADADGSAAVRGGFLEPWTERGVASATLLHTRSRQGRRTGIRPSAR